MNQTALNLRLSAEAQEAVRARTNDLISPKDAQTALRNFYQLLKNDPQVRPFVFAFPFDEFCDTIRKIEEMGMTYTDTGYYIPIVTFCYVTPLSAAMQYFQLEETSREDFETVMKEFFYGDTNTAAKMQEPFVVGFREGIRRAMEAQEETERESDGTSQRQTPPMQTALVQTKPHEQPCGKEQPGNIRERQEEKRNDFNRAPTPAVHPTVVARQNSGTNPPPRRPEIPRAAYVERAQEGPLSKQTAPLGMNWFHFLIYAGLFLSALLSLEYAIGLFINVHDTWKASADVYWYERTVYILLCVLYVAYAMLNIARVVWAIIVRFQLAKFLRRADDCFIIYLATAIVGDVVYYYFLAIVLGTDFLSLMFKGVYEVVIYALAIGFVYVNSLYFKKRKHLFVNEPERSRVKV